MGNNLDYLIRSIQNAIPAQVLGEAFGKTSYYSAVPVSVEASIANEVINGIVLPDCNVIAGQEMLISLAGCQTLSVNEGVLVKIPLSKTDGREIMSAHSLNGPQGFGLGGTGSLLTNFNNTTLGDVGGSYNDTNLRYIGNNTVLVMGHMSITGAQTMKVTLGNSEGFSNLSSKALPVLAELCIYATKFYVHNRLTLEMSEAVIRGGVQLNKIADIVDSYSDARELYQEYKNENWRVTALYEDPSWNKKYLSLLTSGR